MSSFDMASVLLLLAVVIGIANERTLRLPRPVALLLGALVVLAVIVSVDTFLGEMVRDRLRARISHAHLPQILLDGVVALLLFAGALQIDLYDLRRRAVIVFLLSTVSVFLAAVFFGIGIFLTLRLLGNPLPLAWCLVAGAILAPTDAVAVEGLLARVRLPPGLHATIAGESMFNDGAAVVLFGTALSLANGHTDMVGHGRVVAAILIEGGGGVMLSVAAGYLGYRIIRLTEDGNLATTISLAFAISTYRIAAARSCWSISSSVFRLSWTPILSGVFLFYLPIVWIGFDPVWVYGMVSASLSYQFFVHTELVPRIGWLEWVINSPSAHRVHHACNPEYIDKNYGGVLLIWDHLFGTYRAERDDIAIRYGLVHGRSSPNNPFVVAYEELWLTLKRTVLAGGFRARWACLWGPP